MAATDVITAIFDTDSFTDYEKSVYEKYQEMAEREIAEKLNSFLLSALLIQLLKIWGAKSAYKFKGFRPIKIRLKSGRKWEVSSPVFLKAKSKKKGRCPKRRKDVLKHLGLELLGIIDRVSPGLIEICVPMAVLSPSFEVAANVLRNFDIEMNQNLLQNIVKRFAKLAMVVRVECYEEEVWKKPGIKVLICVDGGRFRERRKKRGKRKAGQKRQGFHAKWIEPRLLTISQFDENGKKIRAICPIIDGSCNSLDAFFELVQDHLIQINLDEASEIVFCADGGKGIWSRIDGLISKLELGKAKRILDYTHAKQNIKEVKEIISNALKLSKKKIGKLSRQIKKLLWNGNIKGISELVREKLQGKIKAVRAALKKLKDYFADHSKFQYNTFRNNGLPTGSGTVESAIRRVINLRIKGAGMFWKRKNAEKIIFLRSLVLTGKLKNTCQKALGVVRKMFDTKVIKNLPIAA